MLNDLLNLFIRLPFPIQVGLFIFVAWIVTKVLGQGPTPDADRSRADATDMTAPQNTRAMTSPPPLPTRGRGKQKKKRDSGQASEASRLQAALDARDAAERKAAAVQRSAPKPDEAMPARRAVASNARRFLQGVGGRDAIVLSEILGKPKSAE